MRKAELDQFDAIRIGGFNVTSLRYADDTILITTSIDEMENLLQQLTDESKKAGLSLNVKKTKVMHTGDPEHLIIDGERIENVEKFIYLGAEIDRTTSSAAEIKRRLGWVSQQHLNKQQYGRISTSLCQLK